MKSIYHTFADAALIAICAAWLVYGFEPAGNIYTAWAWFLAVICTLMLLSLPLVKDKPIRHKKPKWRERIIPVATLAQIGLLFWHGQMLIGGLILYAGCAFFVVTVATKEIEE